MIAALTAALKDSDKEVRETAMHALVQMRDPSIFEPLLQASEGRISRRPRAGSVRLGQMRDRRAVQPLIGAIKDENADVREQVVFALGQLRDPARSRAWRRPSRTSMPTSVNRRSSRSARSAIAVRSSRSSRH